ncbi:MAG: cation:proton antiporter [ANME-2 cluster archaeon]|nr:cation:proton antiporter [ANME-2 cluster archaeon]
MVENTVLLTDIVLIFSLAVVIVFIFHKLRIVPIVGYLLTGVLIGPSVLGLVKDQTMIEQFAEIGVILLLFTIGIEFSLGELLKSRRFILIGGGLQVILTTITVAILAMMAGLPAGLSVFIGFLVALSSTAIVLKLLSERGEVETPHGRFAIGILIFQDLSIILMVMLVPVLAGGENTSLFTTFISLFKAVAIVALVLVTGRFLVPVLLYQIVRTRNRELFLMAIVMISLGTAMLTSLAGLSLAIGAFLVGLIISESEYSHQALSEILPLRDVFNSLFFISIGMLLDMEFVIGNLSTVFLAIVAILLIKFLLSFLTAAVLGYPFVTSILVGLSLAQIGEFSFVLSLIGIKWGLLDNDIYQIFLASAILTMMVTPFMIQSGPWIELKINGMKLPKLLFFGRYPDVSKVPELENHVVIAGYGINGRNLSRVLSATRIPFVVVEMNPETVISEKRKGTPIIYGDASKVEVLKHTNISRAKVLVVAISDAAHTRMMVETAKRLNPAIYVIARTRYVGELETLIQLGADEVIPEEFETSIEIFSRVLSRYLIPREEIQTNIEKVRTDGYEMFRDVYHKPRSIDDLKHHLMNIEIDTFVVKAGSVSSGKSLAELQMRKIYGFTVLAIKHQDKILTNPQAEDTLLEDDTVIVMGPRERLGEIMALFTDQ